MEMKLNVKCICGAELTIQNFVVDEGDITKRDAIELSRYHLLQSCPECDENFTGESLEFKPNVK